MSPATLTRRTRVQRPSLLDLLDGRAPAPAPASASAGDAPLDHHASAPGGGPTLDELLAGVWEGLSAHRTVPCPVCGGSLAPRYGAGPGPVGGRCRDCASTIA
jgi:hypothetical protein